MNNYYKIDVIRVSQLKSGSAAVFTGKFKFSELLKIHRLTERKESTIDPFGEMNESIKYSDEEFQRHLSPKKLDEIKSYIRNEIQDSSESTKAIYPSSVIISLDLHEDNSDTIDEGEIESLFQEKMSRCFVCQTNENFAKLYIPKVDRICLIVDGQHRFYGLKKYYEEINDNSKRQIEDFEFITTILLGFDPYQVAEVFANVNFHQKPVNRSLYYDIFGASSTDRNQIQFAHFLTLHLQNSSDSPICSMIKLLGKGYGLFSQSFLVEKLVPHFNESGVWFDLYNDFKNNGNEFYTIPEFIKQYFQVIEMKYNVAWPIPVNTNDEKPIYSSYKYDYILCKTTGMGALLRLIRDVFPLVKDEPKEMWKGILEKIFGQISDDEINVLFSKTGEFGGGGSEGLQLKLYRRLKYKLSL